jgi:DNA replication and repair protein RecF
MIDSIRLQNFRSYEDSVFELSPKVNIIVGPNASGKTNLLEAVLFIARGGSYKARDIDIVRIGSEWTRIDAQTASGSRAVKIKTNNDNTYKTHEIDGQIYQRLHHSKTIPVVLFEPNHLSLLSGSPDMRRTYLDDLIEQIDDSFGPVRRHYRRVLSQRNTLLKKNPRDLHEQMFVWNVRLSELGGQIAKKRTELIQELNHQILPIYKKLATKNNIITLEYSSKFSEGSYETELLKKLESNIDLESLRGFTIYGPHRDDLMVKID